MAETKTLKIGIAGSGNRSQGYARALGQVERVRVTAAAAGNRFAVDLQRTIPGVAIERDVGGLIRRANVDAIVFADPVVDLAAVIRRALLADKHVLATISSPVTCRQLDELASLAGRQEIGSFLSGSRGILQDRDGLLHHPAHEGFHRLSLQVQAVVAASARLED